MSAVKRKSDARSFSQSKRKRRKLLTFMRMLRYGVNNFSRNAWLTIAATAIMTITLLVVFSSLTARSVLVSTVNNIRDSVSMSIYVKTDTTQDDVNTMAKDLRSLSSVKKVVYITPQEGKDRLVSDPDTDSSTLNAINEAPNVIPGTFQVTVEDINNVTELQRFVDSSQTYKENADPVRPPSFAGSKKDAINVIGQSVQFAERFGIGASILFMAISSLIVFNTIRMAIYNRKDEIQMMKLIGADKSFIRGPFIVEAIVYGVIAGLIASAVGISGLLAARDTLLEKGLAVAPATNFISGYLPLVILFMVVLGGVLGTISSLMATRRYLKV